MTFSFRAFGHSGKVGQTPEEEREAVKKLIAGTVKRAARLNLTLSFSEVQPESFMPTGPGELSTQNRIKEGGSRTS